MSKETEEQIQIVCNQLAEMLIEKNRKYGDSALNPTQVFSSCDPIELINIRMDDKLSRMRAAKGEQDREDPEWDLMGYLVLKRVALRRKVLSSGLVGKDICNPPPGPVPDDTSIPPSPIDDEESRIQKRVDEEIRKEIRRRDES